MPDFRADHVDAVVWGWLRDLLLDPAATLDGLRREQSAWKEANKPLRDRLAVVDDLLTDNRHQLKRALDLYLEGDLLREMLIERTERLQSTIDALERERGDFLAQLEAQTLTDEQIESILEFTQEMRQGLEAAELDFEKRRQLIEALDVRVRLAVEDGQKIVYVRCKAGKGVLSVVPSTTT